MHFLCRIRWFVWFCEQKIRQYALDVYIVYAILESSNVSVRHLGSLWGDVSIFDITFCDTREGPPSDSAENVLMIFFWKALTTSLISVSPSSSCNAP
jgi:hypothetical protein